MRVPAGFAFLRESVGIGVEDGCSGDGDGDGEGTGDPGGSRGLGVCSSMFSELSSLFPREPLLDRVTTIRSQGMVERYHFTGVG